MNRLNNSITNNEKISGSFVLHVFKMIPTVFFYTVDAVFKPAGMFKLYFSIYIFMSSIEKLLKPFVTNMYQ